MHSLELSFPDFAEPFILETDVSGAGLGAVLETRRWYRMSDCLCQ